MKSPKKNYKKLSASERPTSKLHEPCFFLDRSIQNPYVEEAFESTGCTFVRHDSKFSQDTADQIWLEFVGKQGWIVITKDKKIRYRPMEIQAVLLFNVGMFCLSNANITAMEQQEIFKIAIPKIKEYVAKHQPPYIVRIIRGSGRYQDVRLIPLKLPTLSNK